MSSQLKLRDRIKLPVVYAQELIGYVHDRGYEASFYDMQTMRRQAMFRKDVIVKGIEPSEFYNAAGNRDDVIAVVRNIGELSEHLQEA